MMCCLFRSFALFSQHGLPTSPRLRCYYVTCILPSFSTTNDYYFDDFDDFDDYYNYDYYNYDNMCTRIRRPSFSTTNDCMTDDDDDDRLPPPRTTTTTTRSDIAFYCHEHSLRRHRSDRHLQVCVWK